RHLFAGILTRLERDVKATPALAGELVNELGWYAATPYDFTGALVQLSLELLARSASLAMSALILNDELDSSLRLVAVETVCKIHCIAAYDSVLRYLAIASHNSTAESYSRIISRILAAYWNTGTAGLTKALLAFDRDTLGPQSARLLAGFRGDF